MTTAVNPGGFVEIPEDYRPKRMEFRARDDSESIMAWAVPKARDSSTWCVYMAGAVVDGVGLSTSPFNKGLIREVNQTEAQSWVIGLGMLAEAWLFRVHQ